MFQQNTRKFDISVVINAHSEGRLAHRSVKSALQAAHYAEEQGIKTEIIAVIDSPTKETLSYFNANYKLFNVVSTVAFRDVGLARNHGVELAQGQYIAFLDADDLFSENWLAAAFHFITSGIVSTSPTLILHSEFNIEFSSGGLLRLFKHEDSMNPDYSPLNLVKSNYWDSLAFVSRDFFINGNQYDVTELNHGFGYEDWHWNCETICNGAQHRIVPETVHFKRIKDFGLIKDTHNVRGIFRPTKLFSKGSPIFGLTNEIITNTHADLINGVDKNIVVTLPNKQRHITLFYFYRKLKGVAGKIIKNVRKREQFSVELSTALKNLLARPPLLPHWLITEWKHIHKIEPELFPTQDALEKIVVRELSKSAIVKFYPELYAQMGHAPTHVYLLPWLKRGGADLGAIHFISAVSMHDSGSNIICITTHNTDSPWLSKVPPQVKIIEFGKIFAQFTEDDQATLLLRLLIQTKPNIIHNLNSALGYRLFTEYGRALSAQSALFTSVFCEELSLEGNILGYPFQSLPFCIDYLSGVLTDNGNFIDKLCDLYAFDRDKFSAIYFPSPEVQTQHKLPYSADNKLNVLWAGRPDRQKRPDVLIKIAAKLKDAPVCFHVYGEPHNPAQTIYLDQLKRLSNVSVYGRYDGFDAIPTNNYDLFLYTTEFDGLPNVLLEAIASRLPVIAPDVGGIGELINDKTGFLVSHAEAVDEYVEMIRHILRNRQIVASKIEAAIQLVETRHSWESFVNRLKQVPGYFVSKSVLHEQASME